MTQIHACVEQFLTALDEDLCDADPRFTMLKPDVRLHLLVQAATNRFPDFVRSERRRGAGVVLPGAKLEMKEDTFSPLPSRDVPRSRKTKSSSRFEIIEKLVRAFRQLSLQQLDAAAAKARGMLQPACDGVLLADDWNRDGRLRFLVTEQGASDFGEPAGSDWLSGIGSHRDGTGKREEALFVVRFGYGAKAGS
jgi:hypothetical protein